MMASAATATRTAQIATALPTTLEFLKRRSPQRTYDISPAYVVQRPGPDQPRKLSQAVAPAQLRTVKSQQSPNLPNSGRTLQCAGPGSPTGRGRGLKSRN